nr:MAG TPA: hypothetical protein [Caudoviricetes sp.]
MRYMRFKYMFLTSYKVDMRSLVKSKIIIALFDRK